jgi:hypothetical protein
MRLLQSYGIKYQSMLSNAQKIMGSSRFGGIIIVYISKTNSTHLNHLESGEEIARLLTLYETWRRTAETQQSWNNNLWKRQNGPPGSGSWFSLHTPPD